MADRNIPAGGDRPAGLALATTSAASMPFGQAVGAHAFDVLTPAGVVAIRQLITALVLLPIVRPRIHRLTWSQWWPVLTLGVLFVAMNLTVSLAIDRIGVALALTLEFLGPLSVALAGSRGARDLGCAVAAGFGVYILILPDGDRDLFGLAAGLAGAACWASYILLNRTLGRRLAGLQATALAASFATILCLPVLAWLVLTGRFTGTPLLLACVAGVLSSIVPYVADLLALRRVPAQLFAITMSLNPLFAATAGVAVLDEAIEVHEWVGIVVIVLVNLVTGTSASRRSPQPSPLRLCPARLARIRAAERAMASARRRE
jgi:inner membrane transporter RhtA